MVHVLVAGLGADPGLLLAGQRHRTQPAGARDTKRALERPRLAGCNLDLQGPSGSAGLSCGPERAAARAGEVEALERRRHLSDLLTVDRHRERRLAVVL